MSITAAEQAHVDNLPRADAFDAEWCYYGEDGRAKNVDWCHAVFSQYPFINSVTGQRQSAAMTLGPRTVADPEYTIKYYNTYYDVWIACAKVSHLGCTETNMGKKTVHVVHGDRNTLAHELENHIFRDIKH